MNTAARTPPSPVLADLSALKIRQQASWSAGDYAVIGTTVQIVGEQLCEALDVRAGERVLDVAAGNGNAALAAARRGCVTIASDYVPQLLERAADRARADGLVLETLEADAEALPFEDADFDVVMSTFGVMFTADHERAAAQMARVCRSGGRIGMANWTPDGFIGELFKVIGAHVPPPAGARSPAQWGTRANILKLFEPHARAVDTVLRQFVFRYRSPQQWLEVFRTFYGPVLKAFAALDVARRAALERDMLLLVARFNRSRDFTMVVPSEYLEIVIQRR
jgi:ubiquinone/menaquinone biosynthesis C-methylase UbiE